MQLLLDGKNECSSYKMWDGSDIIFSYIYVENIPSNIFLYTTWKLGSSLYIYIYMLFTYVFGTEGRGTRSNHRVCWPYHTSKHMAHSIQRWMLGNVTEMTILIFIAAVQAAVQLHVSNAASMKSQWAHAAPALHTHRFCAAHAPRRSCLRCERDVTHREKSY